MRIRRKPWWLLSVLCLLLLTVESGGCKEYARSDFGRDDLCGAAYNGDIVQMWLLLHMGANPSRVGWEEHFTPLGETVRTGQVKAAHLLLDWGADPNVSNDHGWGETAATTHTGSYSETADQKQVRALIRAASGR